MDVHFIAIALLVVGLVLCIAMVFFHPHLSGERQAENRRAVFTRTVTARVEGEKKAQRSRREQVEGTLKELEARRRKAKNFSLSMRIMQAGLSWTEQTFWIVSVSVSVVVFLLVVFLAGALSRNTLLMAAGFAFAGGFGLPRWVLGFLKKRREKKFLAALPDAVDVVVRGVKAGLPLYESIKVVARDSPDPLRGEFQAILDTQAVGMPLGEACLRLYDRMPLPEANFFGIVISIQQKSGGNLSEALGNLSRMLRERKKMREKIQAMSMEAKASAAIIGSLPIMVALAVYVFQPGYITVLFTHPVGHILLAICAGLMGFGTWMMRAMINFDF
ncbi:MAG: type II secretion system F family protein [Alphaproteobacteria bacterium]|nr:type II secretion system F family protein [Alphaproteobacteria bacterium]